MLGEAFIFLLGAASMAATIVVLARTSPNTFGRMVVGATAIDNWVRDKLKSG